MSGLVQDLLSHLACRYANLVKLLFVVASGLGAIVRDEDQLLSYR